MINPVKRRQEQVGMSLADFLEEVNSQPFDLIKGKKIPLMPGASLHSEIIRIFFRAIDDYGLMGYGEVFNEMTFILPDADNRDWVRGSRTPDVMFYMGQRLADYKAANPDWRERPFALVPGLVAEVISPTDKDTEVDEKIDTYLQDGVRLVVIIDPRRQKITIDAPDLETPMVLRGNTQLEGGEVLPGFQLELKRLFV